MANYDDFPVADLVARAEEILAQAKRTNTRVSVFFKATCPKCGARPMFDDANTVYETMECCDCGHVFPFTKGNYMVMTEA